MLARQALYQLSYFLILPKCVYLLLRWGVKFPGFPQVLSSLALKVQLIAHHQAKSMKSGDPQIKRKTVERAPTPQGERETGERAPGDDSALRSSHRMVSSAVWEVTGRDRKMNQEHMITPASGTQDKDQESGRSRAVSWRAPAGDGWREVQGHVFRCLNNLCK